MKYYIDITLLPEAEDNIGFIWQKLYQQIHIALAENKIDDDKSAIAASFPKYSQNWIGNKLRLLSPTREQLNRLNVDKWLSRLRDYIHCKSIKEVPSTDNFVCFKRKQFHTNVERYARRRAKYKGETLGQSMRHYAKFKDEKSELPFINIQSLSERKRFRLFIEKKDAGKDNIGGFNCYGLSKGSTIPWF